jgi:hypothetical protein
MRCVGYTKLDEREIHDCTGRVAGKAIGQGDDQLWFRLPEARHQIVCE